MTRPFLAVLVILLAQIGTPPALEAQSPPPPPCPKDVRQC